MTQTHHSLHTNSWLLWTFREHTPGHCQPPSPWTCHDSSFYTETHTSRPFLSRLRWGPRMCHIPEAVTWLLLRSMCSNYSPRVPNKLLEIPIITDLLHDVLENYIWISQLSEGIWLPSSWKRETEGTSRVVVMLRQSLHPKNPASPQQNPNLPPASDKLTTGILPFKSA